MVMASQVEVTVRLSIQLYMTARPISQRSAVATALRIVHPAGSFRSWR